jgi:hypothetical protein
LERPQQQITNAAGRNQLRSIFEPLGWAVREIPQDTDVGIDFEVEVFKDFKSAGTLFKVQLKSSANSDYLKKQNAVREHVKRKHLTYYCKELTDPVILIHADVKSRRTFWLAPQLMHFPSAWLNGSEPHRKAALNIPVENELPQTLDDLIRTIGQIKLIMGTRTVLDTPIVQFLKDIKQQVNEDEAIRELRDKSDALRLNQIQQLFLDRKFDEAKVVIEKTLADSGCSAEIRFWALLEKERVEHRIAGESGVPQGALPQIHLRYAREQQGLTQDGPPHLKFYALISRKAAELDILSHRSVGLMMNYRNLVANESGYWALHAYAERLDLERQLWRKFKQCIRLARYASNSAYRSVLPRPLCRIPMAISLHLISLRADSRDDVAKRVAATAFQVCELAAWIAERNNDAESMSVAASAAVPLSETDPAYADWAKNLVLRIKDAAERADGVALVDRQIRRAGGEKIKGDLYGEATEEQVYLNMANAIGIDVTNQDDPMMKLVRAGIADSDPTRVLETCRHIFVSLGPVAMRERYLLERLGLPTGPKVIHCEKYRYALMGKTLDDAFSVFQAKHCANCPGKSPRPEGWKYSHDWYNEEGKRLTPLVREFRTRNSSS